MLELNKIYNMDCLEGMKLLDDNSVDSIVTDPPYELGFMGKKWDSTGIAHNVDLWKECLRVLKPGGHLLAFGGTRTYHRMTCAIEDAGFEIRDCIQWLYSTGFPKSHDISKAIDKKLGAKRDVIGKSARNDRVLPSGQGGYHGNIQDTYRNKGRQKVQLEITTPATPEAQQWDGWGTALKPAHEPICVARKPLSEKNVALNVLKWGTGGLNIDGCRIGTEVLYNNYCKPKQGYMSDSEGSSGGAFSKYGVNIAQGRFPANVILDEEAGKLLDEQSGILKSGASRFFYCAKASKKERGEGNNHPTVKPLSLIKYLITLVTPPGGICLDPFEGSGTHALACKDLGFNYIGFELNPEYCKMAEKRIEPYLMQQTIFELLKGGQP